MVTLSEGVGGVGERVLPFACVDIARFLREVRALCFTHLLSNDALASQIKTGGKSLLLIGGTYRRYIHPILELYTMCAHSGVLRNMQLSACTLCVTTKSQMCSACY